MKKKTVKRKKAPSLSPSISVKKLFFVLFFIAAFYFLFLAGSHSLIQLYRQSSRKHSLVKEIDSLQAQKTKLENESKRLKNDLDYIEKIAREKYNMKKKDEKVYKIIKEK